MARYSPASDMRERDRTAFNDSDSGARILAHALIQHHRAHHRSLVEAGIDSRPFSGGRRFGGNERGQLHGWSGMEPEDEVESGQS